jgi:hypothetical protein
MASYIHVPTPCHENWNNMQPEAQGRHCLQCCKTVVDFTGWEVPAIAAYLENNATQGVCGRFNTHQLQVPITESKDRLVQQVFYSNLSFLRKIAAVILIVFGLTAASCNDDILGKAARGATMGEPVAQPDDTIEHKILLGDTILMPSDVTPKNVTPACASDTLETTTGISVKTLNPPTQKSGIQ